MWLFPRHHKSRPIISGKDQNGNPIFIDTGGFPSHVKSAADEMLDTEGPDKAAFLAKIVSVIGSDVYWIEQQWQREVTRGGWRRARWLKSRSYDPPLAKGTWVVAKLSRAWRREPGIGVMFFHPGCGATLGEIKAYCGTEGNVPAGWKLCTKANLDAGAVNGITPPNLEGRFIVGVGAAANQTLNADDTAATYALGDKSGAGGQGGFNDHGETPNNHAGHTGHGDHVMTHNHGVAATLTKTKFVVDLIAETEAVTGVAFPSGTGDGLAANVEHTNNHTAHSHTDNRPVYYALSFIVFCGV